MGGVGLDGIEIVFRKALGFCRKRLKVFTRHFLRSSQNEAVMRQADVRLLAVQCAELRLTLPELDNRGAEVLHVFLNVFADKAAVRTAICGGENFFRRELVVLGQDLFAGFV